MKFTDYLPFASSAVMVFFVVMVFRRYFSKSKKANHLLLWGIGLTMYFIGSLAESWHAAFGWNPLIFRLWYLAGAVLVAAWLGQGTVELLMRRRVGNVRLSHIILGVLVAASLYATVKVFTARLEPVMLAHEVTTITAENGASEDEVLSAALGTLAATALDDDGAVSESRLSPLASAVFAEADHQGISVEPPEAEAEGRMPITATVDGQAVTLDADGTALLVSIDGAPAGRIVTATGGEMHGHAIVSPGVRVLTPFFNMYGLLTLVGGAIYSAFIFWRKRIMPNRVIGNVLIAAGAMMPGMGGLLSRFGMGGFLYIGELLGAILMFIGFIRATTIPQEKAVPETAPQPAGK